jgi:signal transduction histidine kinase
MEGRNRWALVVARDITERKQAELEREYLRDQLRGMAAKREEVREEERRHIAREVHDELGQILSALKLNLIVLARKFSQEVPALREQLAQTTVLTDEAIGVARNIATTLRPVALDLGFVPALEWLVQWFESNTGIPIELHAQSKGIELDEPHAIALFRIVQEALTNVTRHAQASSVTIFLKQDAGDHILIVRDDGTGFDTHAKKPNSFGLVGMKERALMLGGALSITSEVGGGTEITVRIPIQIKEQAW